MKHVCSSTKGFEVILNSLPGRWDLTICNSNAKPLFECLSLDSRQTGLLPSLQYLLVRLNKHPTLGLSLEEVSPTVHLHKWLTLGTQNGGKLLNSTNRRRELKIDDLLFVFCLPPLREQRESACPSFLTSPNGKIQAFPVLPLWVSCVLLLAH